MNRLIHELNEISGQSTQAEVLGRFLDKSYGLPGFVHSRGYRWHVGYEHGGRFSSGIHQKLPSEMANLVRGVIHHYRKQPSGVLASARAAYNAVANVMENRAASQFFEQNKSNAHRGAAFADWFQLGLWEPGGMPAIHYQIQRARHDLWIRSVDEDARDTRFYCDVPVKLVLYVGTGETGKYRPTDPNVTAINERAYYAQTLAMQRNQHRWFKVGCYVPESAAMGAMDFAARRQYEEIKTWYHQLHGYERAKEGVVAVGGPIIAAGKVAGRVAAAALGAGADMPGNQRPNLPNLPQYGAANSNRGDPQVDATDRLHAAWYGNTDKFNRKNLPPAGFVFVKFNCTLEFLVARMS